MSDVPEGQHGLEKNEKHGGPPFRYFLVHFSLIFGGMLHIGHTLSFSGILLPQLSQELSLTKTEEGLIASSSTLGTVFMSLVCSWLTHHVGRKRTLVTLLSLATLGFLLPVISKGQTLMLVLARLLQGMGVVSMAHAIYVAETSSPRMRGIVSGLANASVNAGILEVYALGALLSWPTLSVILAVSPALSVVLLALWAPETPAWLLMNGCDEEAERSSHLMGLQCLPVQPDEDENELGLLERRRDPVFYRPLFIVVSMMSLMMLSGGPVFPFFTVQLFEKIDSTLNPQVPAIFIAVLRMVGGILGVLALGTTCRRPTLILSNLIMASSILLLAFVLHFEASLSQLFPLVESSILTYVPLAIISVHTVAFGFGMGVIPFVLLGELALPQNAAFTSGLGVSVSYSLLFLIVQCYPVVESLFGLAIICCFFGLVSLLTVAFVFFLVPETHNKTMQEVAKEFESKELLVNTKSQKRSVHLENNYHSTDH